jgi:chemotaxis signal transduction protein
MAESTAWILDFGNSIQAAVGELEMVHLDEHPKLFAVPKTPYYCRQSLIWNDTIIPVIDIATGIGGQQVERENNYVAIVRYKDVRKDTLIHAALLLAAMPIRQVVDDSLACPLPEQPEAWQAFAFSCFDFEGKSIPILDLARLFSQSTQKVMVEEEVAI